MAAFPGTVHLRSALTGTNNLSGPLADWRGGRLESWFFAGESGAGNVGAQVHELPFWIILPAPDMQGLERPQPKTVRSLKIVKEPEP